MNTLSSIPFDISSSLSTWFSDQSLAAGLKLLEKAESLFYRSSVGVCFPETDQIAASLIFKIHSKIRQGFAIHDGRCSLCGTHQKAGKYCDHVAAAAISALDDKCSDSLRLFPLPLSYSRTAWHALGCYLFNRYEDSGRLEVCVQDDSFVLTLSASGHDVFQAGLSLSLLGQITSLFAGRLVFSGSPATTDSSSSNTVIAHLWQELVQQAASETELQLLSHGQLSMGQKRDGSIWMFVMGICAGLMPEAALHLGQDENKEFIISAVDDTRHVSLRVQLERQCSDNLLRKFAERLDGLEMLEPATEFTRVKCRDDGSLFVTPCLRQPDGRVLVQEDLQNFRFDSLFLLTGEELLPMVRQLEKFALRPKKKQPLTLFDMMDDLEPAGRAFTIEAKDVPMLLEKKKEALHCPDNDIDPKLTDLKLVVMPDSLKLLMGEEEDGWYYISGHYGIGSSDISLADLLQARENGMEFLPGCGLKLSGTPLDWFYSLGQERISCERGQENRIRLSQQELLHLTTLVDDVEIPEIDALDHIRHLIDFSSWRESGNLPACPQHLRHYQANGLAWLHSLWQFKLGGILADDMGLGKTHQALGLLWLVGVKNKKSRFLVVCPTSVASHWQAKIREFYPELSCSLYYGPGRSLDSEVQVVITTYGIISQPYESLVDHFFDVVIFDEMQNLKNKKTIRHQVSLSLTAALKVGLTGTPLENNAMELKSLFDVCLPGLLGTDKDFMRRYVFVDGEDNAKQIEDLSRRIGPFLLRRERKQVLTELPDVIEDVRTCKLSDEQVLLYRQAIGDKGTKIVECLRDESAPVPYMDVLALIILLKQLCNHPALVNNDRDNAGEYSSGKWDLFIELLDECLDSGMKVVVFSQFTGMLDIIESYLQREKIGFAALRGNMSLKKRCKMIDRFQSDQGCRVFCASLLAGGVGVDLTAAQVVIHYDRWWNAAKEDQATARVHRMGQKQVVQVFKLITVGTLEEKIHRMIESKREMAARLLRSDDAESIKMFQREDLLDLLRFS